VCTSVKYSTGLSLCTDNLVRAPPLYLHSAQQRRHGIVQILLEKASERFPQFQEHARFLDTKTGGISRFGNLVSNVVLKSKKSSATIFGDVTEKSSLSREQFSELLKTIDLGLRSLPATAQVLFPPLSRHQCYTAHLQGVVPCCCWMCDGATMPLAIHAVHVQQQPTSAVVRSKEHVCGAGGATAG
jgi:hypothetical protein